MEDRSFFELRQLLLLGYGRRSRLGATEGENRGQKRRETFFALILALEESVSLKIPEIMSSEPVGRLNKAHSDRASSEGTVGSENKLIEPRATATGD